MFESVHNLTSAFQEFIVLVNLKFLQQIKGVRGIIPFLTDLKTTWY